MGWSLKQLPDGTFDWSVYSSAYGCIVGDAQSLAEAKVRLIIAEADLYEQPFPRLVVDTMLADVERFAAEYPDPPHEVAS